MKTSLTLLTALAVFAACLLGGRLYAQDDFGDEFADEGEPALTVNGSLEVRAGVFVPLISDGFEAYRNKAYEPDLSPEGRVRCDPVKVPTNQCIPEEHGKDPGSMSMGRGTLQLEAEWTPHPQVVVFGILRGVRSMPLEADEEITKPLTPLDPETRREVNKDWVHDEFYEELELREIFVDAYPSDWFSVRLGRQQVAWGDLGQYRLLDVVNPSDNTWHWSTLESFKDTKIPLWMAKALIEMPSISHSLELLWAPLFFDEPDDTVNKILTFVGAWGVPMTNTPGLFVYNRVFRYPGGDLNDMRGGFQWKGEIGEAFNYSLVYYYTHQLTPPVAVDYFRTPESMTEIETFNLEFPRQHITGLSMEYAFENPIGMVAKIEGAVELPRTYPTRTNIFTNDENDPSRNIYKPKELVAVNYGVQLTRPTMIRFLNPTQNFLLVLQFLHTMIPGLTEDDKKDLTEITNFNKYFVKMHSFTFAFVARTIYLNGLLTPTLSAAFIPPDNGYYSLSLDVRLNEVWKTKLTVIDFFGGDPYKSVGLFRDRDEVNLTIACQF
ncbi:MAG: hypothetical protein JXA30_02665 [Deltaproteobacteria bacterium]|nr:hypothetical protein [Deltaproteobacteria bacterium]